MGKANQNFVQFWCEAEQTSSAKVSWMLWKRKEEDLLMWALRENWYSIRQFEKVAIGENQNEIVFTSHIILYYAGIIKNIPLSHDSLFLKEQDAVF